QVDVFGKTDLGQTRDHNEDIFIVADLTRDKASLLPEVRHHDIGDRGSLFMVADGMGGAAAGELASAMAADLVHSHLASAWRDDPDNSLEQFALRLREALEIANRRIHSYAGQRPEVKGMGTTATAAGVLGIHLIMAQVGDSRAYLIRNGEAVQLTRDQSLTQRLVDAGEMTEEEAERSERRNIILQALGPEPNVVIELTIQELRLNDVLVLCSDGLTGTVRGDEIAKVVTAHPEPADACSELISMANDRGGPDNITVAIARFTGDALKAPGRDSEPSYLVYQLDEALEDAETEEYQIGEDDQDPAAIRDFQRFIIPAMIAGLILAMVAFYFATRA
ncbi:MAG: protein phosphatase 2C domain-containing protein, partial [Gemmatimonadetes bacterium]|nr:protein phosphatase 2C domain-containing protein [Gemmatimonadota bacterium]